MKNLTKRLGFYSKAICFCCFTTLLGCDPSKDDRIQIDLGRSDPDRILSYYFGIYGGSDPFESALIVKDGEDYFLDRRKLAGDLEVFSNYAEDGKLDWDELKSELESSYYKQTNAAANLDDLVKDAEDNDTFGVEVHGVMSEAKRTISIEISDLQQALLNYEKNSSRLVYPINTTFVARHHLDDVLEETTVMKKISESRWAYWVYDAAGRLSAQTTSKPRQLKSPTQCIGCHMGQKAFEPEASFPSKLEEKETRRRQVYVGDELRSAKTTAFFDEHQKRDDSVLGLYATLYISQLQLKTRNDLSDTELQILDSFSL